MRKLLVFLLVLGVSGCLSTPAWADFDHVVWQGCYDGDTCRFTIPNIPPVFGKRLSVRLRGVDTPELRGHCQEEKMKAQAALHFVTQALSAAEAITLGSVSRGKYFRLIADVIYDGKSLSADLLDAGLARPYTGGTRGSWCES